VSEQKQKTPRNKQKTRQGLVHGSKTKEKETRFGKNNMKRNELCTQPVEKKTRTKKIFFIVDYASFSHNTHQNEKKNKHVSKNHHLSNSKDAKKNQPPFFTQWQCLSRIFAPRYHHQKHFRFSNTFLLHTYVQTRKKKQNLENSVSRRHVYCR